MRRFLNPVNRRQRGTTLLEALVAFLVLSLGMLTVARMQTQLRSNADVARQRSEAVRLAQEDLERLRSFAVLAVSAGQRSYDAIESGGRSVDTDSGFATGTRYQIARQIDTGSAPRAKSAVVTVSWTDRTGNAQQVALNSMIGGTDPAYSGALGLARGGAAVKGPLGRSIAIPVLAKDLGNGTSALKASSTATIAFLFDNASGAIVGRCTGMSAGIATRDLARSDLTRCDTSSGYLLSGAVRFAPNALADAVENALPSLAITLALSGGTYATPAECTTEALKTISYTAAGSLHIEAVPLAASAAVNGATNWSESGERFVAYQCVVHPLTNGQWSGAVTLAPSGWSIGSGATDRRVCRYVSDVDGSGSIDANIEHPASYGAVSGALAHQDFLVINGADTCPSGHAANTGGTSGDLLANANTVQLQP